MVGLTTKGRMQAPVPALIERLAAPHEVIALPFVRGDSSCLVCCLTRLNYFVRQPISISVGLRVLSPCPLPCLLLPLPLAHPEFAGSTLSSAVGDPGAGHDVTDCNQIWRRRMPGCVCRGRMLCCSTAGDVWILEARR